jgi:hypothetical protein
LFEENDEFEGVDLRGGTGGGLGGDDPEFDLGNELLRGTGRMARDERLLAWLEAVVVTDCATDCAGDLGRSNTDGERVPALRRASCIAAISSSLNPSLDKEAVQDGGKPAYASST